MGWVSCCALAALGCQPVQVVQPVPVVGAPPQAMFAAPPMVSGQGVMVDPFAMDQVGPVALGPPSEIASDGAASRIHVSVANREWTWEQIVDAVDDYFRIERERQVQLVGDVLTEGRIDVHPQIGATIVEPHRRDSVGRYNRWESTFQTIRRRATIRVIPDGAGYLVEAVVEKDLEDLPRPEYASAGVASFRNDSSLPSTIDERQREEVSRTQLASRWILIGRDPALEQRMLSDIQSRLAAPPVALSVSR